MDSFFYQLMKRWFLDQVIAENGDERETAITFLEVDPWCNHSGYLKEKLIRALKQAELDACQQDRLRRGLRMVEERPRREFRDYCRLAVRIADADFYAQLQVLTNDWVSMIKQRARWMADYIDQQGESRRLDVC